MNISPIRKGSADTNSSHHSPPPSVKSTQVTSSPSASISTYKFIATPSPTKDKQPKRSKSFKEKGEVLRILEVTKDPEEKSPDAENEYIQEIVSASDVSPLIVSEAEYFMQELGVEALREVLESVKSIQMSRNREVVENQKDILELIEITKRETEKCVEAHVKNNLELDKFNVKYDAKKIEEVDVLHREMRQAQGSVFRYIQRLENIETTLDHLLAEKYMKKNNPHDGPILSLDQLLK